MNPKASIDISKASTLLGSSPANANTKISVKSPKVTTEKQSSATFRITSEGNYKVLEGRGLKAVAGLEDKLLGEQNIHKRNILSQVLKTSAAKNNVF